MKKFKFSDLRTTKLQILITELLKKLKSGHYLLYPQIVFPALTNNRKVFHVQEERISVFRHN